MLQFLKQLHADYGTRVMEPETIQKNGASPKSQMSRRNFLIVPVFALIVAGMASMMTACKEDDKGSEDVPVTDVFLSDTEVWATVGTTYTLWAEVYPEDATNRTVTWTTGNSSVATVNADGDAKSTVTLVGTGTVTITAKAGNQTAACEFIVLSAAVAVTGISLDKIALTLDAGNSTTLTATVLPANATDKTVTWTTDNSAVATVSGQGEVSAIAAGTATVTARAGSKTAVCTVTVPYVDVAVTGISLDKTNLPLFWISIYNNGNYPGFFGMESYTLTATVLPANATDKTVQWASSDKNVATVTADGKVEIRGLNSIGGTATITAFAGDKTATCVVTILDESHITISDDINGFTINGVRWATRNVDAPGTFAAKPEDAGKFYQWNRKKDWPATGDVTGWPSDDILGSEWASANDPSPAGWRVPTKDEMDKLFNMDKVRSKVIYGSSFVLNGIVGVVYKEIGSTVGLFLPYAGSRSGDNGNYSSRYGFYWSSTPDGAKLAYGFSTGSAATNKIGSDNRSVGNSIRSVAK